MEDAFDCLQVLHPNFDHVFLLDQSSGHTKKAFGGCDIYTMSVGFGGKQPIIKDSTVKEEDYGKHNKLRWHDFTKTFKHSHPELKDCTDNDGPCWMHSIEERLFWCVD